MLSLLLFLVAVRLIAFCTAHPAGHDEISRFQASGVKEITKNTHHKLSRCSSHLKKRGIQARTELRRAALLKAYRQGHLGASTAISAVGHSDANPFFLSSTLEDRSCVLTPETTIGPFRVRGESIRSNITDGEAGVPLILDGLFIDVNTCEPIEDLYWEMWSCNSVGQYSGVLEHHGSPLSNLNTTFLRGLQKTDKDESAQFETIFPGHYEGRATHIHVLAHVGATVLPNNTLTGGHVPHISQLFFEQELITAVEASEPYRTNKAHITLNSDDGIFSSATADGKYDPVLSYTMLGDKLSDEILASVTMGIDVSASYRTPYAAELTDHGGVSHRNSWHHSPQKALRMRCLQLQKSQYASEVRQVS
ncbi:aromatic compound dioxygenase [Aspergillus novoparasiticus]|uniref:Aromatic compound dioxygenase n=1 Tax=Aspergillus novoparasiticus TaxID=986946 RepID=A0A5N6F0H7_9EURO|nr:aromatic compound dioxygenase [Aspergillus novoparasiticus]